MLLDLFSPGKKLMRQLRMPVKFALIVTTLLIPLAMLLHLYVGSANDAIGLASHERTGLAYERILNPLVAAVQEQRGQALRRMLGREDQAASAAARQRVGAQLDQLERELRAADPFQLAPLLTQLRSSWSGASGTSDYADNQQITASYGAVDKALALLRRQVAQRSELALDPEADSYNLMLSATEQLPRASTYVAQLRGLATYAADRPEQLVPARLQVAARMALLRLELDNIDDALLQAEQNTPGRAFSADRGPLKAADAYLAHIQAGLMDQLSAQPDSLYTEGSRVLAMLTSLNATTLEALDQSLRQRADRLTLRRNGMLAGVALALALACYALTSFYLAALSGFKGISQRVVRLGQGDLSASGLAVGSDEISESINQFRTSVETLGAIVRGVREAAESIGVSTSEIAAGNHDLSSRGAQIAETMQQAAENMHSLASKVANNLDNARQADQLARSALAVASRGETIVQQAVGMMERITVSSRKIGDIISVIDGIAFQTNILALNAAVEAARAGEQGRGFAVVASEVRNLAQRSAAAAKEIGSLITESISDIHDGARHVNDAGSTMKDILSSVQRVTGIMDEITLASNAQSDEINQMAAAIGEVDASTQQNAAMVEQISATVMALDERTRGLSESVRSFKVDGGHPAGPAAGPRRLRQATSATSAPVSLPGRSTGRAGAARR